ncbi:MAG TPA: hypothetical protein PLO62_00155 [Candidatus Hydrogenedentes bacterium]|nr:hypothetical protein [Candidatus Hydrogenedentota bacterium]HOS01864.1 hypothetical protein [Candidatus Hydrogenedentota bacterium]
MSPPPRCPGQDQRYWKPEDIFMLGCPWCGAEIEFWKDEPVRVCRACARQVRNPRMDMGCAAWCASADQCLGVERHPPLPSSDGGDADCADSP